MREAQAELARVTRMTTLGELTASIAHEINQPLGAIVTNANAGLRWLGAETPNVPEVRQTLTRIHRDANRAADVIGRIRSLAKKSPLLTEALDVNDVVRDVLALTRAEMERNRIALRTELAGDLPLISGDKIQLQQVILNLVVNAIEAMHEAKQRSLSIKSESDAAGNIRVSVGDSGPGLDPATADRIFSSFFTTKPAGMGMGLSICRSIVERHGGKLLARANAPHGAIFEFELPGEGHSLQANASGRP
jgi:C4-dicarboxylate-specific signal transduction histidine kinase